MLFSMDSLEIDGEQYISARQAAKEHGYVADYIGQLIRGGKLQGRKVGRAWYVSIASLEAHFQLERTERTARTGYISEPKIEKQEAALEVERAVVVGRSESKKTADSSYELLNYIPDNEPTLPQFDQLVAETSSVETKVPMHYEVTLSALSALPEESKPEVLPLEETAVDFVREEPLKGNKMAVQRFNGVAGALFGGKLLVTASFILAVLCLAAGAASILASKEVSYSGTSLSASLESLSR